MADIEADPNAITPKITVGQFMALRRHIDICDRCFAVLERVLAKQPKEEFPQHGEN